MSTAHDKLKEAEERVKQDAAAQRKHMEEAAAKVKASTEKENAKIKQRASETHDRVHEKLQ